METKICSKCGKEKELSEFRRIYNNQVDKYYYRRECHECELTHSKKNKNNYILYFNSKIKESDNNKLTRDNYCIPTNEVSLSVQKELERRLEIYRSRNIEAELSDKVFKDKEHYTDEYVKNHYERCMKNFDLNMKYFNSLEYDDFNNVLNTFVEKYKFIETKDLNEVNDISGVYILVLDQYKQVYIGISNNIKKRILTHWSTRKEFTRLIWGDENTSIISIDSFGAFDTTRIFYKKLEYYELMNSEEKYVKKFKSKYLINRVAGGINDENTMTRNLQLIGTQRKRKM